MKELARVETNDKPPRRLLCGCCVHGCICEEHRDRQKLPRICEYHALEIKT